MRCLHGLLDLLRCKEFREAALDGSCQLLQAILKASNKAASGGQDLQNRDHAEFVANLPPEDLFSAFGGDPTSPDSEQLASEFWAELSAMLTALSLALKLTPSAQVQAIVKVQNPVQLSKHSTKLRPGVFVEEVPIDMLVNQPDTALDCNHVCQILLLVALYIKDEQLPTPWTNSGISDAATQLLSQLSICNSPKHAAQPPAQSSTQSVAEVTSNRTLCCNLTASAISQPSATAQDLLAEGLVAAAKHFRSILVQHALSERQKLEPYKGSIDCNPCHGMCMRRSAACLGRP